MKKLTYFVPVDFTACSYNALQYAAMLARFAEGKVKIVHVLNLDEIPESDNPVLVSWKFDELNRRAKSKMKSLQEMISLEGIEAETEIVAGNLRFELLKQIERSNPHVIIIGRDEQKRISRRGIISFLTKNTSVPVLVVPGSHSPKLPNKAMLVTDFSYKANDITPLLTLLQRTSQNISVFPLATGDSVYAQSQIWMDEIKSKFNLTLDLVTTRDQASRQSVQNFIRDNQVDMVCTVNNKAGLLDRLFGRQEADWYHTDHVPMLVFSR